MLGFHRDEQGDWVAELDCLHTQHVRHRPPFQPREWVTSTEGRSDRVGDDLDCPLCDRAELPDGLVATAVAGPFDQDTVPVGLRRAHRVAAGTWGELQILSGRVGFRMSTDPPIARDLATGDSQAIPPQVDHVLEIAEPVRLQIRFLVRR